jgi:hypothetical protein
MSFYSTGKKEERETEVKREKKNYEKEGRKMNIVCLRMETVTPEKPMHAYFARSRVYAPTKPMIAAGRWKAEGRKGAPLQHGTRFDKLNGLLRTRGDTTREWLRMAAEKRGYGYQGCVRNHGGGELTTYLTNPVVGDGGGWTVSQREGTKKVARCVGGDVPPVNSGSICTSFPSLSCARRSNTDSIDETVMKIAAVE